MTEVDKLLQNAKENLYQNEIVKEYFRLAEIIKNDAELLSLEQNMKVHERGMTLNIDNDEVYFKEKELFASVLRFSCLSFSSLNSWLYSKNNSEV